ncbi:hypothetical protein [Kitasatospora aureofaciens]|uniref:hypothetical protein n=1 Tax=Kitasatospora aureofaciens TaxID=1894 RepID=UPI0033C7F627
MRTKARIETFNDWAADRITAALSSMWCAYAFAGISLVSLPAVVASGDIVLIIAWLSQSFIQLVALSILAAGQDRAAAKVAAELHETHDTVMAEVGLIRDLVTELHELHPDTKPIK